MKMQIKLLLPIAMGGICVLAFAQESKPTQSVPAAKTPQPASTVRAEAQSIAVVIASPAANTNDYKPSTDRDEAAIWLFTVWIAGCLKS